MGSLLYLFFGILPSIVWLTYFLRKDVHPEPNSQVLRIFFFGALITLPVLIIELTVEFGLKFLNLPPPLSNIFSVFLGVALIEELFKYFVVKKSVLSSPEFDEPIDAMLYMIIVALGFAAIENILLFFKPGIFVKTFDLFSLTIIRFLGATFLHALCSGIVGFFLALSFFYQKNYLKFLVTGLTIATLLHGLYNFAIIEIEGLGKLYSICSILIFLALFVSLGLRKLKRLKSICEISLRYPNS